MVPHRVLFDPRTIAARVDEIARRIGRDLPDRKPLIIGLLTGGFVFLADLVRAMAQIGIEPQIDFMAVTHYGGGTESRGKATIYKDAKFSVQGRTVLIVDDILDSGNTLRAVCKHLEPQSPTWLRTCVLLDKPSRRCVQIEADYVGFEVPDSWIIGYGLDLGGEGRALPYIAVLESGGTTQSG